MLEQLAHHLHHAAMPPDPCEHGDAGFLGGAQRAQAAIAALTHGGPHRG
jgi:hypothetical protein